MNTTVRNACQCNLSIPMLGRESISRKQSCQIIFLTFYTANLYSHMKVSFTECIHIHCELYLTSKDAIFNH